MGGQNFHSTHNCVCHRYAAHFVHPNCSCIENMCLLSNFEVLKQGIADQVACMSDGSGMGKSESVDIGNCTSLISNRTGRSTIGSPSHRRRAGSDMQHIGWVIGAPPSIRTQSRPHQQASAGSTSRPHLVPCAPILLL